MNGSNNITKFPVGTLLRGSGSKTLSNKMLSQNLLAACKEQQDNNNGVNNKKSPAEKKAQFKRQRAKSLFFSSTDPDFLSVQERERVREKTSRKSSVDSIADDILEAQKAVRKANSVSTEKDLFTQLNRRLSSLPMILRVEKNGGSDQASTSKSQQNRKVDVHPYTEDPNVAWEMLKSKRPVKMVRPMKLDTPLRADAVRFVCISDTHSRPIDPTAIPPGDVLLVAGDFTACGLPNEVRLFNEFLGRLPHPVKVVVVGNHELTFDERLTKTSSFEKLLGDSESNKLKSALNEALRSEQISDPRSLLSNALYLQDSSIQLFGLNIYGTPWLPICDGWGFNLTRGSELLDKWNKIPAGLDVLLTHTPPLGHGDLTLHGNRAGCVELLNSVCTRIRPKYHVFGHIHEGAGCTSDGYTKFINASICDTKMRPINPPILFDIPLPTSDSKEGYQKMLRKSRKVKF